MAGVIQLLLEIRADSLQPVNVAIGIAKIMFSGLLGFGAALLISIPGWRLMHS